jgi:hypothetical protein
VSGALHSIDDGMNGVYSGEAGAFPTDSWRSSHYFVDLVAQDGPAAPQSPAVAATTPVNGASGVARNTPIRATFDIPLDPATISDQTFTLRKADGTPVPATVSYDESALRARLTPAALLDPSTSYVARLTAAVQAHDGTPLPAAVSWAFTTTGGASPQVSVTSPIDAATQVSSLADVRATFTQAMDPATVTDSSFTLHGLGAPAVPATVAYDALTRTATLHPMQPLTAATDYTATVTTAVRSTDGTALEAPVSWSFTTSGCPCSLFGGTAQPAADGRPVRDGRPGPGPFSYEMGVKLRVNTSASLTALRFYKSPGETGTHIGRVWTATGTPIAQVTFTGESAWGWQEQALPTPLSLTPGQTYVVSAGINDYYVVTSGGLASSVTDGPLASVADGQNGVFGSTAGIFPTDSWASGNYFIDAVVR